MRLILGIIALFGAFLVALDCLLNSSSKRAILSRLVDFWYLLESRSALWVSRKTLLWYARTLIRWFGVRSCSLRTWGVFLSAQLFVTIVFVTLAVISSTTTDYRSYYIERLEYEAFSYLIWVSDNPTPGELTYLDQLEEEIEKLRNSSQPEVNSFVRPHVLALIAMEGIVLLLVSPLFATSSLWVTMQLLLRAAQRRNLIGISAFIFIDIGSAFLIGCLSMLFLTMFGYILPMVYHSMYGFYGEYYHLSDVIISDMMMDLLGPKLFVSEIVFEEEILRPIRILVGLAQAILTMWWSYFSDLHSVLSLRWTDVTVHRSLLNWAVTFTILPSIGYLWFMTLAVILSRSDYVRRYAAASLAWLVERERGFMGAIGTAIGAFFGALRFIFF